MRAGLAQPLNERTRKTPVDMAGTPKSWVPTCVGMTSWTVSCPAVGCRPVLGECLYGGNMERKRPPLCERVSI